MTSPIYASLLTLLVIYLSMGVIKIRKKEKISLGDGGNSQLEAARSAMSNACEYIPLFLILLFSFEYQSQSTLFTHLFGIVFVIGRVFHATAISNFTFKLRFTGMVITFLCLLALAITNLLLAIVK